MAENVRFLAPSTRGYTGSSPFPTSLTSDANGENIRDLLGRDLVGTTAAFVTQLQLLENPESRIKLLAWSAGNIYLLSAFSLLTNGRLGEEDAKVMKECMHEIIIFDPPATMVLGNPVSASTRAYHAEASSVNTAGVKGFQAGFRKLWVFLNIQRV